MTLKSKLGDILLSGILLCCLSACSGRGSVEAGRGGRPSSVAPAEQEFLLMGQQADVSEIDIARIALKTTENPAVRDFANMIQTDGTRSLEDVTDLLKDKNIPQTAAIAVDVRRDISRMVSLRGPEFDREFINMIVMQLQQTVDMFRDESAAAIDADIEKYTDDLLPQLEMHLDKARRLQSKLFASPRR